MRVTKIRTVSPQPRQHGQHPPVPNLVEQPKIGSPTTTRTRKMLILKKMPPQIPVSSVNTLATYNPDSLQTRIRKRVASTLTMTMTLTTKNGSRPNCTGDVKFTPPNHVIIDFEFTSPHPVIRNSVLRKRHNNLDRPPSMHHIPGRVCSNYMSTPCNFKL